MSFYSDIGCAKLGEIIEHLRSLDPHMVVEDGFNDPYSYRGYYEDLAFHPAMDVTVREMLEAAESAVGKTFEGYKGGNFTMSERTDCWLAVYGCTGIPIVLPGRVPRVYVLPDGDGREAA